MKLFFSLTVLFLSISILLFQTNSFTKAEITSEARLSVVSEENSLIAISYGNGKKFTVTNNTGETIEIVEIELMGDSNNRIIELKDKGTTIKQGGIKEFNITADPKKLTGKIIQLIVRWEGGSAVIKSIISDSFIKNLQIEVEEQNEKEKIIEQDKEQTKLEKVEEPVNPEVKEDTEKSELVEEPVIPIVEEESANLEAEEEPVDSEVDGEQSNPVVDEDK